MNEGKETEHLLEEEITMSRKVIGVFVLALVLCSRPGLLAQAPTSRVSPFSNVATSLPGDTLQTVRVELWDQNVEGNRIMSELHESLSVDTNGLISFLLG